MAKLRRQSERGFTLIELLTIIGIIGVLSALGIVSFKEYKKSAAYAAAVVTLRNARNSIEASLTTPDVVFAAVPLTTQATQGPITDPNASAILPNMQLGPKIKLQVSYDPTCNDSSCQSEFLQVNHCLGDEYAQWVRFGDGLDVWLDHLSGAGC